MLNVGLMIDDTNVLDATVELLSLSLSSEQYRVAALIVVNGNDLPTSRGQAAWQLVRHWEIHDLLSRGLMSATRSIEYRHLGTSRSPGMPLDEFVTSVMTTGPVDVVRFTPEWSVSGKVLRFTESQLSAIQGLGCDVLVRGGRGILRGGILRASPLGVLSIHAGDNRDYRGGPAGFWEVFHREPSTGFVVQQLTEELDGGKVIARGNFPTRALYVSNEQEVIRNANQGLHHVLESIGQLGTLPDPEESIPYSGPLYRAPSLSQQARYSLKQAGRTIHRVVAAVRRPKPRWGLGLIEASDWRESALWRAELFAAPSGHFWADPFVIKHDDSHYIFVEDFDYEVMRGRIGVLKWRDGILEDLGIAIDEETHLSYPFLLKEDNELYMCPESRETREIRLYRCVEFPLRWELSKVLIEDIEAVDSNVFRHEDRWWIMTNIARGAHGGTNAELAAFHADSLDSSEWTAHAQFPLVSDSRRARNAGLICEPDGIYRCFQRPGFNFYGESMGIARIDQLTETSYHESDLCSLLPNFKPSVLGIHTFNYCDGLVAFDYLSRRAPSPALGQRSVR